MNIYITLDYEMFFGDHSGSVEDCFIKPTNDLLAIVNPYNIKLVIFVDVGYLVQLENFKSNFPQLQKDYDKICQQIEYLGNSGHAIELHIHPHWENTIYDGKKWVFDTSQYRLQDFSKAEAYHIITKYYSTLSRISGTTPIAYRAGGWSAQPFSHIKDALADCNVFIDSTTYPNGYYESSNQFYDFKKVPQYKTIYRFESNLVVEESNGRFIEYPISSSKVSPLFFWRFALEKLKKSEQHVSYGKGSAIKKPKKEILRLMTTYSNSVVSIDGYKANFLEKAFKKYIKNTNENAHFVIIGHPKAFTPYSLQKTKAFIANHVKHHNFTTFKKNAL
ncbi:MAG: hypothetical protein HRT67_11665 [Flavobacteriaceae bacterium]|nr:hypothetical protein [Flavobacteriaceae bacterium]